MSVQGLVQNHTLELLRELLFVPPVSVVATFSVIMIVTYALIMTERLHKTLAALGGAVATILAGKYFSAVYSWVPIADCVISWMQGVPACGKPLLFTDQQVFTEMIDWPTIIIIISLVIIATVASRSGLFEYVCVKVVKMSGGDLKRLFAYLCLVSFVLTAIIGNNPTFIIISALTLTLTRALGVDPRPYVLGEVFVINAASASTIVGSFVNILVSAHFNLNPGYFLSYVHFIALGAPFAAAYSAMSMVIVQKAFKEEFTVPEGREFATIRARLLSLDESTLIENRALFNRMAVLLVLTTIGFVVAGTLNIPLYMVALVSAFAFLLLSGADPERTLLEVDWGLVVFLVSIFIIVGGVHSTGVLETIGKSLGSLTVGNPLATIFLTITVSGVLSGVMDNVSVTTALLYVLTPLSVNAMVLDKVVIWSLIYGANAGASLTPIGGIPNLLAISILERDGAPMSWKNFFKIGGPLCLVSFIMGTGLLYGLTSILGWTAMSPELFLMVLTGFMNMAGVSAGELGLPSWITTLAAYYGYTMPF